MITDPSKRIIARVATSAGLIGVASSYMRLVQIKA
jgi:hypothetical protein